MWQQDTRRRRAGWWCGAAAMVALVPGVAAGADFVFGNFENGLDPFLELMQESGGPNFFNGSVPDGATRGTMAGSFTTAAGWQMYLRYNNGDKGPGSVTAELPYYNNVTFDITVPAGTNPNGFYVHEIVFNSTGTGWAQSGNVVPVGGGADLKGQGTVTLSWPYQQAIFDFESKYAAQIAAPTPYFQVILIANHGGGWDGPAFTVDNLRLTRYRGDANEDGKVDGDDYARIDRGAANGATGWENGDFDLNGSINAADYLLIDRGLAHQNGVLSPELLRAREAQFGAGYVAQLVAAVPEPGLGIAAFGAWLVVGGRRRGRVVK